MTRKPRILLVGAGAIGCYYSAHLAKAGAHVSTLCRSDYETVKKNGIQINSIRGNFHFTPEKVLKNINEYDLTPDFLVIATKVLPEIDIPKIIKPAIDTKTTIVILQNGINIEEKIAKAFPKNEILSGLAFICVKKASPGIIEHQDYGRLNLGLYPSGKSEKAELFAMLLKQSGIPCDLDTDILSARWKKLVWNAPFNPISVLGGGVNTKTMMETPECLHLVISVMNEVSKLADASGHPLPEGFIEKNLNDTLKMTPYKTSMLLDFENNRQMEVEAILGNTVRIAEKFNIDIPYIKSLYALLTLINNSIKSRI